jgi:serine phosphatase RsbU (regulator of sigma subunit)
MRVKEYKFKYFWVIGHFNFETDSIAMNRFIVIILFCICNVLCFSQETSGDKKTEMNRLLNDWSHCNSDSCRLNKLFEIHYAQQALIGELTEKNVARFNTTYTKQAIALAIQLEKYDTLKSLTIDLGYIFDLSKQFDSSFVYYNNCLNIFEATNNYERAFSLSGNILYNNSLLQNIIEENAKKAIEQKKKIDRLTYLAFFALLLFLIFVAYFFYKTKRSNVLLETQKKLIFDSKTEIESSINYAQNLQQAILANEGTLNELFKESFVLFLPRDNLSGDFVWTYKKSNSVYVAVIDCTGHGVPGALLSIVGHFLFDSILSSTTETSPAVILDLLHHAVVKSLNQEVAENNRDGMDVAICRIDLLENKLIYAGAHRSLYHFRNNQIKEFKGTRRPIGGTQIIYKNPFVEYELDLEKNDLIYFYSDGYPDQIGGERNKKFYNARLLKIIQEHSHKSMEDQKHILKTVFNKHKGNNDQTDDVLMVGIKF